MLLWLLCLLAYVSSRPVDEATNSLFEADLPMSHQDGFYKVSRNDSDFNEISRIAFESLKSAENAPNEIKKRRKGRKKHRNKGRRKDTEKAFAIADPSIFQDVQTTCEGQKFKYQLKHPGCVSKVITTRFCHGTCSSIFIPRMRAKKMKALFESCTQCRPSDYEKIEVILECPGMDPPTVSKNVNLVRKCSCQQVTV